MISSPINSASSASPVGSSIPIPIGLTLDQLPCTKEQRNDIITLIKEMARGLLNVGWMQKELRRIEKNISPVHPLIFLSTILTTPDLKKDLGTIKATSFIGGVFMNNLKRCLTEQAKQGKLAIYLNDFAKTVKIHPESINGFVAAGDWDGMVEFLIRH